MKVWHIIDSDGFYGAEVMLLNLILEQLRINIDATVISLSRKGRVERDLEREARHRNISVNVVNMHSGPDFIGAYYIIKEARKNSIDVIHCHGYKANILFGLMPGSLRKLPVVTTLHGWIYEKGFSKINIYNYFDKISLHFVDYVVAVDESIIDKHNIKKIKNICVINNGIQKIIDNSSDTSPKEQVRIHRNSSKYVIGSIGRLSSEKGYDTLISAIFLLRKENVDVQLVILGDGKEKANLKSLAKKYNIENYVCMPGYVEDTESYLKQFDVMVLPSLTEGLPITLLEAMRARVPIVATNVGGMSATIKPNKGGKIVPCKNSHSIVNAIKDIINNSDLTAEMINFSFENFRENYTSEIMADKYKKIYETLINSKS